jgi:hypothetical protein
MKTAMAANAIVSLYCRCCGDIVYAPKGLSLDDATGMKSWELDALIKGYGCVSCKGKLPQWIRDLPADEAAHVAYGFNHQWEFHLRLALKHGQSPYPAYPAPESDPRFHWSEPDLAGRLKQKLPDAAQMLERLQGGIDQLRSHPKADSSDDPDRKYGLWHVISEELAWAEAETSSAVNQNVWILKTIFGTYSELIEGRCWVCVGHEQPDGGLDVDFSILTKLVALEISLVRHRVLTPEVMEVVGLVDTKTAKPVPEPVDTVYPFGPIGAPVTQEGPPATEARLPWMPGDGFGIDFPEGDYEPGRDLMDVPPPKYPPHQRG